eukprot:1961384-Prorocentrum_lima.AAC.1
MWPKTRGVKPDLPEEEKASLRDKRLKGRGTREAEYLRVREMRICQRGPEGVAKADAEDVGSVEGFPLC